MKLIQIVTARGALQKLIVQDLPLRTAYQVVELVEKCNRHLSFYSQMRQKLGAMPDEKKLSELNNFEILDLDDSTPIEIHADDSLRLSAADIIDLEPFVRFTFD